MQHVAAGPMMILNRLLTCLTILGCISLAGCTGPSRPDPRPPIPKPERQDEFVDVLGSKYRLPGPDDPKSTVLLFIGHDCPISNAYTTEIVRLCKEYMPKGIAFC